MKKDKDDSQRRKLESKEKKLERLRKYLYQLVQLGVNLRQDWFFHIVFGRNESIPFLIDLMNGVFRNADEPTVESIKIKNPFTFGRSYLDKDVVVDVAVEDELGNQYDVEMQMWNHENFRERIVYYLEKIAAGQLSKGETYNKLHRVIGIIFVDFPIWSELDLQKIKNLTPELKEKLKGTQFETIKLMSVENRVVFSDCLTIHFVQIPKADEPLSSNIRDPKLINWLKAFRFPDSTSEKDMLRLEKTTPEIRELRKQMFRLIATPRQRAYIEARQRFITTQKTLEEDNDLLTRKNDLLTRTNDSLVNENVTLKRRLQEKDNMQKMLCGVLATTVSSRFNVPVSEAQTLFEGRTQDALNAACNALASNIGYEELVEIVSKNQ